MLRFKNFLCTCAIGVGSALVVVPFSAYADYSCMVDVKGVLPYAGGLVNVLHTGRGDWTMICSLDQTYTNGAASVSPNTCAMWTSLLLRAMKDNQKVQFWFPGTGSCAALGTYGSAAVPTYIGIVK
jgi:hypothetical protein